MPAPFHTTQVLVGNDVVALRRRRVRVEVMRGPDRKLKKDLDVDRLVVGTHETCGVQLTDPTVSRQHLELALVPSGYALRDLGSTNGSHVGDLRLGEVVITKETRVRVGDTELRVQPLDETVDIPLARTTSFGPLLGRSAAMRRVMEVLERVASSDATVLITGESGTGKEVAARALHEGSGRAGGPFVVVDCASLPKNLIESELYGHERGAYTGADRARVGAFEHGSGGTLFLDEIGELPLELQARLLGVIERRRVQPLGSNATRAVDVRLVAATNRDLRREVNRGTFREDLFFRLAVVQVEMPALRDRPEDIPLYVESFLAEWAEAGVELSMDPDTIKRLGEQPWPGNVRELRNVLERAAALGGLPDGGGTQTPLMPRSGAPSTVAADVDASVPFKVGKQHLIDRYERAYITELMARHEGNITQAARSAEIDRVYLLRLLDKFDLRPTKRK